ncbi:MAG: hypothetical protein ACRC6I_02395, partial [Paracoccaceae bacterium]
MRLLPIRPLLASAALTTFLAVAPTWADETSDANALFVAAVRAWDQAQAMPADDPAVAADRLALIAQANADLDRIVTEMPGADIAVKVVVGDVIGSFDVAAVRAALAEAKAAMEPPTCDEAPTPACLIEAAMADLAALDEPKEFGLEDFLLIEALAVADDPRGALDLLETYPDPYFPMMMAPTVQSFARNGQQDAAEALIEKAADPADRSALLPDLALGLAEAGQTDDALLLLEPVDKPWAEMNVLAAAGRFDEAKALLAEVEADGQNYA